MTIINSLYHLYLPYPNSRLMKNIIMSLILYGPFISLTSIAQSIDVSLPLNRAVYQRNTNNQATIPVRLQVNESSATEIRIKFEKINYKTGLTPIPSIIEEHTLAQDGLFDKDYTLTTGWYVLTITTYDHKQNVVSNHTSKVGVGEVFISAGQSNSQGTPLSAEGGPPLLSGLSYDAIQAINQNCFCKKEYPFPIIERMERSAVDGQKKIAPNGNQNIWFYEVLGREIADKTEGTPVLFFNAASTGSSIENWSTSANSSSAITNTPWTVNCSKDVLEWNSDGPEGFPYRALSTSLRYYGGMFGVRSILWHQGETDNYINTTAANYKLQLENVITRSRQHFNANLGWAISRASHFPGFANNSNIVSAQTTVKSAIKNTTWGAYYSDNYIGANMYRQSDNLHLNPEGLKKIGQMFANGTTDNLEKPNGFVTPWTLQPIEAARVPTISVENGTDLVIDGQYTSYCWVRDNGNINNCDYFSTSSNILPNPKPGKWRCYVTQISPTSDSNQFQRVTTLTGNVTMPLTMRIGQSLSIDSFHINYEP